MIIYQYPLFMIFNVTIFFLYLQIPTDNSSYLSYSDDEDVILKKTYDEEWEEYYKSLITERYYANRGNRNKRNK